MRRILCAVAAFALVSPAAIAEKMRAPEIDPKVCQQMVNYVPPAEGGADYKPGVDVNGKPVVEADITPPVNVMPDKVTFDITVDMAQYLGIATPAGLEAKASMGTIEVDKAGHVTYNGKPLEGEAEKALRALCATEKQPQKQPPGADDNKHNQ